MNAFMTMPYLRFHFILRNVLRIFFDGSDDAEAPSLSSMATAVFCISQILFRRNGGAMAIEVYTGEGWLASSMANGAAVAQLAQSEACASDVPLLITLEGQRKSVERLMSRDLPTASVWLQTTPIPSLIKRLEKTFEAKQLTLVALEGSAYPSELCPKGCRRGETGLFSNILDCFRCPQPQKNQSALREICDHFLANRTLELAIIDTGGPAVEEWYVLETYCRPRSVFIVNSVFALHEGWIAARLRSAGWKEVLSGRLRWGNGFPHMLSLVEETGWVYMMDFGYFG
ncbi:unnamed protein product [Cladocopium goreaui]|uniref:Uncharacterized protein n=1 Tax=Cladocopium goreaui TaxID=2562237 RepID=A0A9P1CCY3_9DINO|nr:unnamed protein product [Cladocopium goreaui]